MDTSPYFLPSTSESSVELAPPIRGYPHLANPFCSPNPLLVSLHLIPLSGITCFGPHLVTFFSYQAHILYLPNSIQAPREHVWAGWL